MIKRFFFLILAGLLTFSTSVCRAEDDTDFDNFAVVEDFDENDDSAITKDSGENIETDDVSLNPGAEIVNVRQFDIAGIMLGMSYDEVNNLFFNGSGLYAPRKQNSVIYTINKDWEYNLDYECRQSNMYASEKCIYSLARNRGLLYVSEIHLERQFTGETIDVYFTSNATDNVVWKIVYKNDVDVMGGAGEKFENQREKKILAFWQGVLDKYGTPNSGEDKWISSENAYEPMMRAYYGQLELTDKGIYATDSANNIQAARENFQAKPYAF